MDTDELDVICEVLDVSPALIVDDAVRAVLASTRPRPAARPALAAVEELTPQEMADRALANTRDGYALAARESRTLHPGEERGVEYYE